MPALLRGIPSNHNGNLYCLNCFHSYSTKKASKNNYCYVEMPDEDNKILKYSHRDKSMRVPFFIYADLECLLEKIHSCQNDLEKSYTEN